MESRTSSTDTLVLVDAVGSQRRMEESSGYVDSAMNAGEWEEDSLQSEWCTATNSQIGRFKASVEQFQLSGSVERLRLGTVYLNSSIFI
jgi:hypothetical protein